MSFIRKSFYFLFFILVLWAGGYLYFAASALILQPQNPEEPTDAIVVLTGGDKRIETGLQLFSQGSAGHLFITGVHPDVSKGDVVKMWHGEASLPECCITLGHQATTTIQNGRETQEWIAQQGYKSIRVVTSHYHMKRALLELHQALPGVRIVAHPVMQADLSPYHKKFWILIFSEYNKTLLRYLSFVIPPAYFGIKT